MDHSSACYKVLQIQSMIIYTQGNCLIFLYGSHNAEKMAQKGYSISPLRIWDGYLAQAAREYDYRKKNTNSFGFHLEKDSLQPDYRLAINWHL